MFEFKLPDVGEGLTEAEILDWQVSPGDAVTVNQTILEIETAKSVVELPCPVAGTVSLLHVQPGETVAVGTVIISIDDGSASSAAPGDVEVAPRAEPQAEPHDESQPEDAPEDKPLVLVGPGPTTAVPRTRRLIRRPQADVPIPVTPATAEVGESRGATRAKPPVRLLAKQLGVDLASVVASDGDVISRRDVEAAAAATSAPQAVPAASVTSGDRETRTPIKGVRKATAAAMTRSAFTAPHVTLFLTVDVTRTMDLLARLKADRAWSGVRLTPLVLVARALLMTIRRHPGINARWDEAAQEIVQPHYVNLGLAAATPRGLIVPNVKDADAVDLRGLADAIAELVATARAGKTSPEEMSRGTITITNIGALGVDAGTPILNPGEAAILAFGTVRDTPWVVDGELQVRKVTQLALSFDHRLVDGELGSNVLATLGRLLEDPSEAFVLS
ncbi:dihydrolipoamide acetyltransferase family protein [Aeromicrobium endophyticum]|uniref:Dihydrolipoamide acetyltransferase component of pyruvate dehydrogenase complex n=1 Tax=Aeromicrobium endophyticum TaxID=2292704 RepID=A0A371PAC1_9ACTN|nr:dihydrolipoamide acetyltransferase family protein [Aeromicrobium endophyticum]REK72871.1 2-oxo acid dehydrogenase subunit E2 [Aeromicrobium endophyticum]